MSFVGGSSVRSHIPALLGALVASLAAPLFALNPSQQISQYGHGVWRMQDGVFPGVPHAVTQTADGYLWIGTQAGLVRFDGARFVPWKPPPGASLDGAVVSLLGAHDGGLWIGTIGGIGYRKGETYNFRRVGRVNAIIEDHSGAVWGARSRIHSNDKGGPLCRMSPDGFQCFGEAEGIPFKRQGGEALIDDRNGGLWIGSVKAVCHWTPGAAKVYPLKSLERAEGAAGVGALALDKDGSLLVGAGRIGLGAGLQKLSSGSWAEYKIAGFQGSALSVTAILFDRDGALWIGTSDRGLVHIHDGLTDVFSEADGLSGNAIENLYEDREGNIWAVSSRGLDRFRELPVVTIGRREGLSGEHVSTVFASSTTIWIGNRTSVDFIRQSSVSTLPQAILPGGTTTSILEDHLGRLWLGMDAGLSVMTGERFQPVLTRDGKPLGVVYGLVEGVDEHIYAIVTGRPQRVYDIQNLKVVGESDVPRPVASSAITANREGGVWMISGNDSLIRYRSGRLETVARGPSSRALFTDAEGMLWSAGLNGVARWSESRWTSLTSRNGLACDTILSALFDDRGSLWLAAGCGMMSIAKSELQRWAVRPDAKLSVHLYDVIDGAQTGMPLFQPTASKSLDGRLWFANENVLQVVDPARTSDNPLPPPVLIESVVADRKEYRPDTALRLPARTRNLRIDFTALSLVAPQKVRFRYVLDGSGQGWQDAENRRQAFYNDLPAGAYRFHVIACNNSGVWNQAGARLDFSVLPAYYQTAWFKLLCVLGTTVILWTAYRIRLRQLAKTINARFDERVAERNRLATDLHDTMLQTVQAAKLIADNARLDHSAEPVRLREAIERVSEWLAHASTEARAALNSLRESTSLKNDLADALKQGAEASQVPASMKFVLTVEGTARDLHPIVRDEIYRIGCEALRNAVQHSGATQLNADLTYGKDLVLRITDNGRGMPPDIATKGRAGHFGIQGMYERASRIRGTLRVLSRLDGGTELKLEVPGKIVYSVERSSSGGTSKRAAGSGLETS